MEGWTGIAHLLEGDVREAATIERNFRAAEIERDFESHNLII